MNKVIEDYVLLEKIGQGQYGNVYKAQNKKNHQHFAVKVMNVEKFKHTPKLSEFTNNEIAILSKINHPNIIKFVQMLRTANNYYLVYEFCNGGTLAEHIKNKGKLSEAQALKVFQQLKSAFEELYNENILHRDLKPTNILFHNGIVKLADFGFCKQLLKQNDMTQTMVGSPIYMAPEVLKGMIYDIRADIWSLGVILYEMIYGVCPYEESTIPKLVSLIDNTIMRFPSEVVISPSLKWLIKKMLTIKYRERLNPQELIDYKVESLKDEAKKEISQNSYSFREVAKYVRRAVQYLGQTLDVLTDYVNDPKYLKMAFLVYKILSSTQKDTCQRSAYWDILKVTNNEDKWDSICQNQTNLIQPFGQIIKQALKASDTSVKTKMELETVYVDPKFYMEVLGSIKEQELKVRLLNSMLIGRHFMMVLDKKTPDFTDYTTAKRTADQKEDICNKFAKGY